MLTLNSKITNKIQDINFFTGGNSIFTVSNNTGEHYTYKIRKPKDKDVFFVSLLISPEIFSYIGILDINEMKVKTTSKSKYKDESKPLKVINWAIKQIKENKEIPSGYGIQHEGRCCKCGRRLTNPESIELGIGPECRSMKK